MTYTVSSPDPSGMVCEVTSTDAAHGFKLVTDYLIDPSRDSVVMRTRLLPLAGASVTGLKVYAQAQYLRLVTDLGSGSLGDQPGIVADRYVRYAPPGVLPVAVTAAVSGSQITVSGTARAGSTVVISAGQTTASSDTSVVVSAVTGPDEHFRASVPLRAGTNVITAAVAQGAHATGWAQVSVKS